MNKNSAVVKAQRNSDVNIFTNQSIDDATKDCLLYTSDAADEARSVDLGGVGVGPVSYTHLRAHETRSNLVCRLLRDQGGEHLSLIHI